MRWTSAVRGDITVQGKETCVIIGAFRTLPLVQNKQVCSEYCCWWQNGTQVKVINIVKPVSNTILLVIISVLKPCSYGPGQICIRPCHTDQLDYLIKVLRTGCFCIDLGIDSRLAVLALGPTGLGANTAHLEYIPGPIQKQPISNTIQKPG